MSDSPKIVHFIWLLPRAADSNAHLRSIIASEAGAVSACSFLFFQGADYLRELPNVDRPNLVILFGSFYKPHLDIYSLLSQIRLGWATPIAVWLTDDPYEFDANYALPKLVDYVFSNDKNSCQYYHSENVYHLPLAASEAVHMSSNLSERPDWDFVFCGVGFPNRIDLLEGIHSILRNYSTIIIGTSWPSQLIEGITHQQHIAYSELLSVYRRSNIVLNMSRAFNLCNSRYEIVPSTPNPRVFEVAAMGVFQLTFFDRPELYEYFEPDEMITYDYKDNFAALAQKYLAEPERRACTAKKAQQRVLNEHLYRHRLQALCDRVFAV